MEWNEKGLNRMEWWSKGVLVIDESIGEREAKVRRKEREVYKYSGVEQSRVHYTTSHHTSYLSCWLTHNILLIISIASGDILHQ